MAYTVQLALLLTEPKFWDDRYNFISCSFCNEIPVSTKSEDPGQAVRFDAFDLGLHCFLV